MFRAFVDFDCVGPGLFLSDKFLLLGVVVFFVFSLEVALESAQSPCIKTSLGARAGFVAELVGEAVD